MHQVDEITDAEILELEELLRLEDIDLLKDKLVEPDESVNPNYKLLHEAITTQKWGIDENGQPKLLNGYSGASLRGSSRSGKTWSGIDIIIWLCLIVELDGCTINIYRATYNEFKTTLYDDFKRRLDDFGLPNPFHDTKEIKSFKIGKSTIFFLGDGKHGGGCDYAFYNEVMMLEKQVFLQSKMRCRKFWWGDYNPSFTDHWWFDIVESRSDVAYLKTKVQDNPFASPKEKLEIAGYEPYLPGSYDILEDDLFYNNEPITETNQPPPHPTNVKNGTADEFMWKVYGLGLKGSMEGVIFTMIHWIDKFPDRPHIYGNDFGFTNDPNALVRYSEEENDVWVELLTYRPIETPEELGNELLGHGVGEDELIACDSSDKYTGENKGTIEMVQGLWDLGWENAFKIAKTKSVVYWLLSLKKKRIHVVKNQHYKSVVYEREHYKWKEIQGIQINQPIDQHNHFFDGTRYCHMAWSEQDLEVDWN